MIVILDPDLSEMFLVDAVPALSGEGAGELDDSGIVHLLGDLSVADVLVWEQDAEFPLAGLDAIVAVVINSQFGVNGGVLLGPSAQVEVAISVSVSRVHQIVGVSSVDVPQFDFDTSSRSSIADEFASDS